MVLNKKVVVCMEGSCMFYSFSCGVQGPYNFLWFYNTDIESIWACKNDSWWECYLLSYLTSVIPAFIQPPRQHFFSGLYSIHRVKLDVFSWVMAFFLLLRSGKITNWLYLGKITTLNRQMNTYTWAGASTWDNFVNHEWWNACK